jgi:NitT/TauT family transport system substrate-binding protein
LPRDQELMTALARGEVDVAGGMLTLNELNFAAQGIGVRMVSSLGHLVQDHCSFLTFVVRREHLESGALGDPQRLRQLRFDTNIFIPFGFWTDEIVRPLGLTIDDLNLVDLPSTASVPAIRDGTIDVTIESEPYLSELLKSEELDSWERVDRIAPGYAFGMVRYGPTIVEQRPDVGERFAVAMLKAVRQYNRGKTARNVEIVSRATGLETERVAEACWIAIPDDGRIDTPTLRGYQEWNVSRGLQERVLDDDELFDHRFIEHANAVLDGQR